MGQIYFKSIGNIYRLKNLFSFVYLFTKHCGLVGIKEWIFDIYNKGYNSSFSTSAQKVYSINAWNNLGVFPRLDIPLAIVAIMTILVWAWFREICFSCYCICLDSFLHHANFVNFGYIGKAPWKSWIFSAPCCSKPLMNINYLKKGRVYKWII